MGTQQTEAEWIEWAGGECPVPPETSVHFRTVFERSVPDIGIAEDDNRTAGDLNWEWVGDEFQDIAAYRVVPA